MASCSLPQCRTWPALAVAMTAEWGKIHGAAHGVSISARVAKFWLAIVWAERQIWRISTPQVAQGVLTTYYTIYKELWDACARPLITVPHKVKGFTTFHMVIWNRYVSTHGCRLFFLTPHNY
ncbi:hypothetical protein VPH35_091913 [Triticum aestivum]